MSRSKQVQCRGGRRCDPRDEYIRLEENEPEEFDDFENCICCKYWGMDDEDVEKYLPTVLDSEELLV